MLKLTIDNYDSFALNMNSDNYNKKMMKTSIPHSFYKIMTKILYWDLTYLYNWLHYSLVGLSSVLNNAVKKIEDNIFICNKLVTYLVPIQKSFNPNYIL